jgi:predicted RNA-binding Zn-ribbon protein involved in translation (DUF1610 family)
MSMIKRGTCMQKVTVSESFWTCPKCGHRDVGDPDTDGVICAKCGQMMVLSSSKPRRKSK